jgi:hypothetical protein
MFTPDLSTAALRAMNEKYGAKVYGKYGFIDAFNPSTGWFDRDVISINAGIILLSAENSRNGNVWKWFMQNQEIPQAMQKIGLVRFKSKTTLQPVLIKKSHGRFTSVRNLGHDHTMLSNSANDQRAR